MKFNFKDLLESMQRELTTEDLKELYKAIFAYNYDITREQIENNPKIGEALENAINSYWENPEISSYINQDIIDIFKEYLFNNNIGVYENELE